MAENKITQIPLSTETPEEMIQRMDDNKLRALSAEHRKIFELTEKANQALRPRMLEERFRRVFLPLLLGKENENIYSVTMDDWWRLTNQVNLPVDIIDPAGNVLFSVPPAFDLHRFHFDDKKSGAVDSLFRQHAAMANQSPQLADKFLTHALIERSKQNFDLEKEIEIIEQWNIILAYYNLPLVDLKGLKKETRHRKDSENGQNSSTEDFIEWD